MPATNSSKALAIVLVVEDEPMLRMAAIDHVEDGGFEALEAANADEAIRVLEIRDDIRIIFTDIDMPAGSMNGLKLAIAVRHRWPPIEIIIVSGHYKPSWEELPERALFFAKPYPHRKIIESMQQMVR